MAVAREGGEVEDVAFLDAPAAGHEAVTDDERTEGVSEEVGAGGRLNTFATYVVAFVTSLWRGRSGAAHAALRRRKRFRIARRNSRAAWRWPSAEGWKPSSA
jgi:hypothetical protein